MFWWGLEGSHRASFSKLNEFSFTLKYFDLLSNKREYENEKPKN